MAFPTSIPTNLSLMDMHGNQTKTEVCLMKRNSWMFAVIPVYILVITVLGIVFNVFVLMIFCLHKKACTVAELYLSNLAVADLTLVCCLPFWAENVAKRFDWPFGKGLCQVTNLVLSMNAYCSIYFLVLISIDRYLALVHPLSHSRIRSPSYAKLGCLLVWAVGFLLSVPTLIYRDVTIDPRSNVTECFLNYPDPTIYQRLEVMFIMFSFVIPIVIISFCTFKIIKALSNRLIDGLNTQKMEQKATTLVLAVLLAFLICWVPYHVVRILEVLLVAEILKGCPILVNVRTYGPIFTYLAYFNSALNPILYVIVGKNFRQKVKELFKQWHHKRTETFSLMSTRTNLSRNGKALNPTS